MKQLLLVALGGGAGAVLRYKLGGVVLHHSHGWQFPLSTVLVNISGCLVAGVVFGLAEKHDWFTADLRLLLLTGVLGGYTTFSAFGIDTVYLLLRHQPLTALSSVLVTVVGGTGAVWLGIRMVPR